GYGDAGAPNESAWTAAGRGLMSCDDVLPRKHTAGPGRDETTACTARGMTGWATRTRNETPRTRIPHAPPPGHGGRGDRRLPRRHADDAQGLSGIGSRGSLLPGDRIISIAASTPPGCVEKDEFQE
ncbi:hypothetical protein THAOC_30105, partial [Thalassiosira oceanica]